jgi:hypothetical protein
MPIIAPGIRAVPMADLTASSMRAAVAAGSGGSGWVSAAGGADSRVGLAHPPPNARVRTTAVAAAAAP